MPLSPVEQIPLPGRSTAFGDPGGVSAMTRPAARAGAGVLAAGGKARLDIPDRFGGDPAATPRCGGNADRKVLA